MWRVFTALQWGSDDGTQTETQIKAFHLKVISNSTIHEPSLKVLKWKPSTANNFVFDRNVCHIYGASWVNIQYFLFYSDDQCNLFDAFIFAGRQLKTQYYISVRITNVIYIYKGLLFSKWLAIGSRLIDTSSEKCCFTLEINQRLTLIKIL